VRDKRRRRILTDSLYWREKGAGVVVYVPAKARVLLLEDDHERIRWFQEQLGASIDWTSSADDAIRYITKAWEPYDLLLLDHDLSILDQKYTLDPDAEQNNSGSRFARSFVEGGFVARSIIVHSWNPSGAMHMVRLFETNGNKAAYLPYGTFNFVSTSL
jgi:hypothetical protein